LINLKLYKDMTEYIIILKMSKLQKIKREIDFYMERMRQFEERYDSGEILQRNSLEEFKDIRKDMFMEVIAPLLFEYKMEREDYNPPPEPHN